MCQSITSHSHPPSSPTQALALLVPTIGAEGIATLMKDVMKGPLQKIIHDGSPTVRKEFVKMLTYWLRNIEDVDQFHFELLPLLLSGLTDDNPDVQKLTLKNVEAIGQEWNEKQPAAEVEEVFQTMQENQYRKIFSPISPICFSDSPMPFSHT